MENIFFERYGLHHELLNSIINISSAEIDKDYREEYIKYHINFISLKEDILIIINQFNKYTEIKKDLDIKKFEDIKLQLKYYIILANTFTILYAHIVKYEYQYEIGFIPNHIFKKKHVQKTRQLKKKKKKWRKYRQEEPDIENQVETHLETHLESQAEECDKLVPPESPGADLTKKIELHEITTLEDSKESIDDILNAVSNPSNETDSLEDTNSISSEEDPLNWNSVEIDNFKKKYFNKNYFINDALFEDRCGLKFMDTFWDKETSVHLNNKSNEKRIYLAECYTDLLAQKSFIYTLLNIDNDPIFYELAVEKRKKEIDEKFKLNEIKLDRKIKLVDKKYKTFKKKYNRLSILIIILSTSLTIMESVKGEFSEHFPTNSVMDIIFRATPITAGGLITFIGAILKFSKYQEKMEEINNISEKSIGATSKLKTLREKLYFANESQVDEIINEYQNNIYDEYNICNQEIKKYVKGNDYDKYLRDIYITDYKIYCLEHDKQSLFATYRPNVSTSLNNPVYTSWKDKLYDWLPAKPI